MGDQSRIRWGHLFKRSLLHRCRFASASFDQSLNSEGDPVGDGRQMPVKADVRKAIGKEAGNSVSVRLNAQFDR
jgi:hypothetical protein